MLYAAIGLFAIGAIFGVLALTRILRNISPPRPVVFTHGLFVAAGLILVIISVFSPGGAGESLLTTSLIIFIIAALGGITMAAIDMSGKPVPKFLAVLHPLIAASAFITLIVYVLGV